MTVDPSVALVEARPALMQVIVRNRFHIAACATAGAWAWGSLLGRAPALLDLLLVASIVLCIYQWNRLTDAREDAINCPDVLDAAMARRHAIEIGCAVLLGIAAILVTLSHSTEKLILVLVALGLGLAYGTPIVRRRRLKSMFLIKNVSSSFGWTLLTVLYPASIATPAVWLAFGCMFGAVFVVELLWDLRDVAGDAAAGIRSVPIVLGVRATTRLILIVNAIPAALVVIGITTHVLRMPWIFVLVNTALVAVFVSRFDDFSGARRRWTHVLVMTQTFLLLWLGAAAHLV